MGWNLRNPESQRIPNFADSRNPNWHFWQKICSLGNQFSCTQTRILQPWSLTVNVKLNRLIETGKEVFSKMKLEKKCFQRAKLGHECDSCGVESPWTNLPMATYWEKLPELIVIGKLSQENMKNLKDVLSFFLHILSPTEPKVKTLSSGELAGATISGKCRPSGSKSSSAQWYHC